MKKQMILIASLVVMTASSIATAQWQPGRDDRGDRGGWDNRGGGRGGRDDDRGRGHGPGFGRIDSRKARQLVDNMYLGMLFRHAEPAGLINRAQAIENEGLEGIKRMALEIGSSVEFQTVTLRTYTPEQVINNVYNIMMGRPVDHSALRTWGMMIRRGQAGEAMKAIVSSPEYLDNNGL